MFAPKDSLEMIPNSDEAHIGKGSLLCQNLYSKVNPVFYLSSRTNKQNI